MKKIQEMGLKKLPNSYSVRNPHQYKTISPGESDTVFMLNVGKGQEVAFIDTFGNNLPGDSYYQFKVDGEFVEKEIRREIGSLNDPYKYDPPVVAEREVKIIGFNNSNSDQTFEIVCNGVVYVIPR